MIIVKDLHKKFEDNHVLRGVNYHVHQGEKIVVVGPSGSGKSTFLRCLNLLETPTSGEIWFDGQKITPKGQGNGGNFAGLAADLNTYVYDKLTSDAYGVGPLGLVQIDFIGATKENFDRYDTDDTNGYNKDHAKAAVASQNLVSFIAMNNFRFPMDRKPGTFSAPEVNDASLDENIAIQ